MGVIVCQIVPGKGTVLCPVSFSVTDSLPSVLSLAASKGLLLGRGVWSFTVGFTHLTRQDRSQMQVSCIRVEGLLSYPHPQSWLLSVRLRPEQPLRALARAGAPVSISLLNYAGALVGRSTLAGLN